MKRWRRRASAPLEESSSEGSMKREWHLPGFLLRIWVLAVVALIASSVTRAQGVVTDVGIRADPSYLQSHVCPVTVVFNGYITMNGPGTVTWKIVRSDGASSPVYSLDFLKPGTQTVSETWTLGDAAVLPNYEGWVAIQVLTPNAVESSHADANFMMTCSAAPPPSQPRRARFRVSLTGFRCSRETRDNTFELDGPGDEIYQAPYVLVVDRSGATTTYSSGAHGPIFGRIRTGMSFPTSTPEILSSPPIGLGVPGVLFEGELVEGERAVVIVPTLWEWDGDHRQLLSFFGACTAARAEIASRVVPVMTGPLSARYVGLSTPLAGVITVPIMPEGDADRPIGISVSGATGSAFRPRFIILTYESAMLSASDRDAYRSIRYLDAEGFLDTDGFNGDYTLYVKVEQIP
jgi:hypothetical protein